MHFTSSGAVAPRRSSTDGARLSSRVPSSSAATDSATSLQLLWIDDHPDLMAPLASQLATLGFDVVFAASGKAGVRMALTVPYAAILVDLRLPDIPGIQVIRTLRSAGNRTPIIVITGYGSLRSAVEAVRAGAADYKPKPLRVVELAETIRSVLESTDSERLSTDQRGGRVLEPTPPRAARIAHVLIELISAPTDAHSLDELCQRASLGVAPATFRRWCAEEDLSPSQALAFARLLRGLTMARKYATRPSEWMELDPRTIRSLLDRGGVSDLFQGRTPTIAEFIDRQRFVSNPLVLRLVRERLCSSGSSTRSR